MSSKQDITKKTISKSSKTRSKSRSKISKTKIKTRKSSKTRSKSKSKTKSKSKSKSKSKTKKYVPPHLKKTRRRSVMKRKKYVREITKELHKSWKKFEWWPEPRSPTNNELKSGIINITIPSEPEYNGVTDIHIHIYKNRNEGSGIRIGYGPKHNKWRLEYEIKAGMGTFYIRNPDNKYVPRRGFGEEQSLNTLIENIKYELRRHRNVPVKLQNITDINLVKLVEMMSYIMEGVQSQRIYGGKRKATK